MKIRFYCDIPSAGVRWSPGTPGHWALSAATMPHSSVMPGFTRVAFDVDMPPNLVMPSHDVSAPADPANVVEEDAE